MRRRSVRLVLVALAAILACLVAASPAAAEGGANLSSVARAADGTVSGVLTVQAGQETVVVDTGSLRLNVAGRDYPVVTQPVAHVERTTMLVIDRSGSMLDSGMSTVRSAVDRFLQSAPADVKLGVVSFADKATLDVAPTLDRPAVKSAVDGLRSGGDTALYDAIGLAVKTLGASGDRRLLLLSDGKDTVSALPDRAAEQQLKDAGIRAQVVAFRTSYTDNLALEYLAAAGQGKVVPVGDSNAVSGAFASAAKALDSQVSWAATPDVSVSGSQQVVLTGKTNGVPFSAATTLDFGAPPATPSPSASTTAAPTPTAPVTAAPPVTDPSVASGAASRTVLGVAVPVAVAAVTVFAGILLLVMALWSPVFKSHRRERVESIDQYVLPASRPAAQPVRTTSISGIAEQLVHLGDQVVEGRESTTRTTQLLQRADLPWRAGEWAVLRVIAVVVGMLLGLLLVRGDGLRLVLGAVLGVGAGFGVPPVLLRFLASRRAQRFERQLPDVLTLVASSLSTGFSLPQALDAVAHDVAQPAAKEFSRAMAETRIGAPLEDALGRLAERMGSQNMRWTTMAIEIQRKVGGNLAETLRNTAATLRERESLFRHVRALSAEGRLSAWILVALPIAILLWMTYVNVDYVSLLWTSAIGLLMSFVAVVLMVVGIFWMRHVVEVEV